MSIIAAFIGSPFRQLRARTVLTLLLAAVALLGLAARGWSDDEHVQVHVTWSPDGVGGTIQELDVAYPLKVLSSQGIPGYFFSMERGYDKCTNVLGFEDGLWQGYFMLPYPGASDNFQNLVTNTEEFYARNFANSGLYPWRAPIEVLATGAVIDRRFPFSCQGPLRKQPAPPPVPPGNCPQCPNVSSGSIIENATLTYIHDAIDYATDAAPAKGCPSCGASGTPETRLPSLRLARYHRYKDMDLHGSFGPGVFSSYDVQLTVDFAAGSADLSAGTVEYFDPQHPGVRDLTQVTTPGVYQDATYQAINNLRFSGGGSQPTIGVLTHWDGTTETFELINVEAGSSTAYRGRLIAQADRNGNAVTITYADPATATDADLGFDRNRLWRIASITDAYGHTMTFTYAQADGQWVVSAIALPNGTALAYQYDTDRLVGLNRIAYPDGAVSTFQTSTDLAGQFQNIAIDDAGATETHRRKTVSFSLSSWQDSDSGLFTAQLPNLVRQVINGAGEISYKNWLAVSHDGQQQTTIFYEGGGDQTGKVTAYTSQDGSPVSLQIATAFQLANDPSTYTWQTVEAYNADGQERISAMTDAVGRPTAYTRDASGAILSTTQYLADGRTIYSQDSTTYNGFEEPLLRTDALGRMTQFTYDASGNQLTKTAAVGTADQAQWSWTYNSRGQPLTATDADGHTTTYVYSEDPADPSYKHLIALVEPADVAGGAPAAQRFTYDAAGRLATSTDASGRTATYSYDARNRTAQILYADQSMETFAYGTSAGQTANLLVGHTDRNGNVETIGYDGDGRKVSDLIAPPAGTPVVGTQSWGYLAGTTLASSWTSNGNTTVYGFDNRLRQVAVTRTPQTTVSLMEQTIYDQTQRIAYRQDAYGRKTYYLYDRNDLVIRTVRELVPNALAVPADVAAASQYLAGLAIVSTANPPYTIEDKGYDPTGELVARIDERGYLTTYEYDGQGRLVAQIEANEWMLAAAPMPLPNAARTQYQYDPQGNRLAVIRPRSFQRNPDGSFSPLAPLYQTTYAYTGRNLLASMTEGCGADQATTYYGYTPTRKLATQSDPRNAALVTTTTYYPCCDRIYQVIDPLGFATTYAYDANGNVTAVLDANGVGVSTTYDARNRPLTIQNTAGETTAMAYDDNLADGSGIDARYAGAVAGLSFGPGAAGSAVATTNAAGETSIAVRDGLGRMVRSVDGNGNATTTTFDQVLPSGLVATTQTDALGHATAAHADAAGRVRERRDAEQLLSTAGYDPVGNQLSARDPNGVGWSVADDTQSAPGYDGRGHLLLRTDTHGDRMGYAYDLDGDATATIDALGNATTVTFDSRDRKVSVLDRVGGTTTYTYDAASNLLSILDADGSTTTYAYDARNLLASEQFPPNAAHQSTVRSYAYDPGKRLQSRTVTTSPPQTPALNEVTTYGYDLANRLITRAYSDGKGNDTFAYDHASRLITATSGRYAITVARSYTGNTPSERAGRLTSETVTISGWNAGTYTTAYTYDAANRTTQISYPSGDAVTRAYTARNLLSSVLFDNATVATRQYDAGGRLGTTTLGNGLSESRGYRSDASGVDDVLTSMVIPGVTNFSYLADPNKRTTTETNGQLPAQTQNFSGYDHENRLTAWSRNDGSSQTWTLSPVGDWQQTTINGTAQSRTHDAVHETTTVSGATSQPTYDGKGNLTTNLTGAQYTWDMENRLATATIADAASGAQGTAWYRYDALGRRIQKSAYRTATTFIHDGAQVIDEFDTPVSRPSSAANQHGSGAGQPAGGDPLADQGSQVTRIAAQPWSSPIPSGFMGDFGQVYGALDNGQTYGWSSDQSANAVSRGVEIALPQFDSFIQFGTQSPAPSATWSIGNLQPGTYAVIAVFGDAASTDQTNDVSIQGISEIDQTPAQPDNSGYPLGNFDGYAETVTVTESGTITIAALPTAFDPKLCFVEIGPVGSSITTADRTNLANLVAQANAATQQTQAIQKKQPSPRLYAYGSYVDEPLMMQAAGHKYYYASNHLYSVAALTDSTGAVVERYKYDAYGRQGIQAANGVVSYSPSDYGNFVGFTGRYHDWETGLVYFRARYMDTGLGRFIGRDPAGYVDGKGLYGAYYVPNYLDPSGKYLLPHIEPNLITPFQWFLRQAIEACQDWQRKNNPNYNPSFGGGGGGNTCPLGPQPQQVDCQRAALAQIRDQHYELWTHDQWLQYVKAYNAAVDKFNIDQTVDLIMGVGVGGVVGAAGGAASTAGRVLIIGGEGEGPAGAIVINNLSATIKPAEQVIADIQAAGQTLIKGDATNIPLAAGSVDTTVGFGVPQSIINDVAGSAQTVTVQGGKVTLFPNNGLPVQRTGLGPP